MSKIQQQFLDFRKSTPKYVQWLLLLAALVSVIVLIVLLMDKKNAEHDNVEYTPTVTPKITVVPDDIDWVNTGVGDLRTEQLVVSANKRIQVTDVVTRGEDSSFEYGISTDTTCIENLVEPDVPCIINVSYHPSVAIPLTDINIDITWHDIDTGAESTDVAKIELSAIQEYDIDPEPEPMPLPEPEPEPDPYYPIVPPIDFEPEPVYTPEPVVKPAPAPGRIGALTTGCSDFAFPGYNDAGVQNGWIKPVGGGYYFYPLSDVNCERETGIYNPDSGLVMDISNPTRKIGSDAEHIRFIVGNVMPSLQSKSNRHVASRAKQIDDFTTAGITITSKSPGDAGKKLGSGENDPKVYRVNLKKTKWQNESKTFTGSGESGMVVSTRPFDRTFVLRQYKPIPATIVSDIQADAKMLAGGLPVRATVDRNVYSDNGRTVIIPTGTLMLGYVTGELPGPYKAVGRMQIQWYQFIRPDGVEFNFKDDKPFAADSQGRKGVPGHGSTDYLQQFVMPMLTAIVPAAVNMIAPISDAFVNQIDLDNNTVVQTGTVRSSELAKNEIIKAWNSVATKLMVDMMDNTTAPFSIAAGTRITVFSPVDLLVTCGDPADENTIGNKACAIKPFGGDKHVGEGRNTQTSSEEGTAQKHEKNEFYTTNNTEELIGQVRSMMLGNFVDTWCKDPVNGVRYANDTPSAVQEMTKAGYSFATVDFYCRSFGTYNAINNEKQAALFQNQKDNAVQKGTQQYNEQVLGLTYTDEDKTTLKNPFEKQPAAQQAPATNTSVVTCDGGANPDMYGCCPGETYTNMGDQGYNCCPDAGGDCFPPIQL